MKRIIFSVALLTGALSVPIAAQSPIPISLELRGGLAIRSGELPTVGEYFTRPAKGGFNYGATAQINILPALAIYGGWDHQKFNASAETFGIEDFDYVDSGYSLGAQASLVVAELQGVRPFFRAGAIFHTLTVEPDDEGLIIPAESERDTGFEVGVGVDFPIFGRFSVVPAVMYRSSEADVFNEEDIGEEAVGPAPVQYFTTSVGFRIRL